MSVGGGEMKKTGLLLASGLVLFLASVAAPKASAEVVVGIGVGTPVYVYPVHYRGFVPRPYAAYVYPRVYVTPAPVYYRYWYPRRYYVHRDFDRRWR
jgi:hypothetical protein